MVVFVPQMSTGDLVMTATELVVNQIILDPKAPVPIIATRVIQEADPDFLKELHHTLDVQYFSRLARAEYRKQVARLREKLPPELDHLPLYIIGWNKKRVRIDKATYSDARSYCKTLGRRHRDHKKNDVKFTQAQAFRDRMRPASKDTRGITAGEALGFDFGEQS